MKWKIFTNEDDVVKCKKMQEKQVLARIMKYTMWEFGEYDIGTIVDCIEGEPEVASHPVFSGKQKLDKITGMNLLVC